MMTCWTFVLCLLTVILSPAMVLSQKLPAFMGTWKIGQPVVERAWELYGQGRSLLDSVEHGISDVCETKLCSRSVGAFGVLDETGNPSLDGMMMDGKTMRVAAVGNLKNVKEVIRVARAVMKYTSTTFLTGTDATNFALEMGFSLSNMTDNYTDTKYQSWLNKSCQPNFRMNVTPDPRSHCGPYSPSSMPGPSGVPPDLDENNHDTVCMIGIDKDGNVVTGTSTNGLGFKIPGRVGDTPVAGAGSYADNEAGGAACTGNGDVILRYLPSYQAVESMRRGMSASDAADDAMRRIARREKTTFGGGIIVLSKTGEHGGACVSRIPGRKWAYAIRTSEMSEVQMVDVTCIHPDDVDDTQTGRGSATLYFTFLLIGGTVITFII